MAIYQIENKRDLIKFLVNPCQLKAGDFLLVSLQVMEYKEVSGEGLPAVNLPFPDTGYQIITYIPAQKWSAIHLLPEETHLYKKSFHLIDVEAVNKDSLKAVLGSAKKNHEQLFELSSSLFNKLHRLYMSDAVFTLGNYSPTIHAVFREKPFELKPPLAKLIFSCISQSCLQIPLYVPLSQYYTAIDADYYLTEYSTDTINKVLELLHKGVSSEKINLIAEQLLGE